MRKTACRIAGGRSAPGGPYRAAPVEAARTVRVYPYLGPVVILPLAWMLGKICLFLHLSETWAVGCAFSGADRLTCVEENDPLVGGVERRVIEVDAPRAPQLVRSSADGSKTHAREGIEVLSHGEPRVLFWFRGTSSEERGAFAEAFRHFVDDRPGPVFERHPTGGSRWGPLFLVPFLVALVLFLARGITLPVSLSVSKRPDVLIVEVQRWPLRSRRRGFDLAHVSHAEGECEAGRRRGGRSWLCLVLADGTRVRIADGDTNGLDRSVAQVDAFLAEARQPAA